MAEIKRVGVVGAGLMGHGIAQVAAEAGYDVVMRDVEEGFVAKGRAAIEAQLRKAVEKGTRTQDEAGAILARITGTTDLAALADRDIVVEAIPEVLEVKRALWTELDPIAAEHTIFATNTSALSVVDQAGVTTRPDRFVGLHFFSPVQRMALVEVVRAITTSDATMAAAEAWVSGIGKQPIPIDAVVDGMVELLTASSAASESRLAMPRWASSSLSRDCRSGISMGRLPGKCFGRRWRRT